MGSNRGAKATTDLTPISTTRMLQPTVQLLHKLSIRSVNGSEKLLKVIKNPITDHLPLNSYKITFSFDSTPVKLSQYLPKIPKDQNIVVFIGAMAHGEDNFADGLVDDKIAISEYSLSASVACGKVSEGVAPRWDAWRRHGPMP